MISASSLTCTGAGRPHVARVAIWLKDFLSAIRHQELGLMFDEAATVNKAVTTLPPAKKALFANIGNMLTELKREDS